MRIASLLACVALLSWSSNAGAQIAVVADGPADGFVETTRAIAAEVSAFDREVPSAFPTSPTHVGEFTRASVDRALAAALADPAVRVVVGLGFEVGAAAGRLAKRTKPIILVHASPELQGLPREGAVSGAKNLTYLTGGVDVTADLARFREVIARQRVAVLIDAYLLEAVGRRTELKVPDGITLVPTGEDAKETLAAIPASAQAVYFGPMPRLSASQVDALIAGVENLGLPSYASEGPSWVERGAFMTLVPPNDAQQRFRRIALYVRDALANEPLESLTVVFPRHTELRINMTTARRINVWPTFAMMTDAVLVGRQSGARGEQITLLGAVESGIARNPGLDADRHVRAAAEAELEEARGALLPAADLSGDFTWIDPDIASAFSNAERTLAWGGSIQQILYSPLAFQGYAAQKASLEAARRAFDGVRLDLVRDVVLAYLSVLQARRAETLTRNNLGRIRTNRGLAELRVEIGVSGPQDIARWEIELADGRVQVIDASAGRNQAEINFNRLLAEPQERPFILEEPNDDATGLLIDRRVIPYVQDPWSFRIFRDFMVEEALDNAPEIARLEALVRAQGEIVAGYRLQLFLPDAFVNAGFTHVLHRSGEGAVAPSTGIAGFPPRDDFTWQALAGLRFRLFDLSRYGQLDRFEQIREQLESQLGNARLLVEQQMRSVLHRAGASGAAVQLRREAVSAAHVNLDAVSDAYRQGTTNIITLIDAQNQALLTEVNASNALYEFLADYAEVERAAGRFQFLQEQQVQNEFVMRLREYVETQRQKVEP